MHGKCSSAPTVTSLKYSWPKRGPPKEGALAGIAVFDKKKNAWGIRAQLHSRNSGFKGEDAEGDGGAYRRGGRVKYRDGSLVD
jgi:hypothetical protein